MRMNQIAAAVSLTLSLLLSLSLPSSALPTELTLAQATAPLDSTEPTLNLASTNAVSGNIHLLLGNPSNAAATDAENYLLAKPQYALSYNATKGIPNWVSWQLNQSWLGSTTRQNDFRPDTSLPSSFYRVTPSDYTGSGYDRGHQTPSGDRTNSVVNNSATFLMTNMIPQTPDLNQGPWEKLESYSRQLVGQGKELYIIAGVEQQKGFLSGGKVTIPARNWKVIVVLNSPGLGLAGIAADTRVIAVDMPNDNGIRAKSWTAYRTTVDQIEAATGYDLLSNVPVDIQSVIESR
jgi:endonuclease G, mitochondrial